MMMRISFKSLYGFKEDYARVGISSIYAFNGIQSFIDSKMSWDSWYYMCCDEDEYCIFHNWCVNMSEKRFTIEEVRRMTPKYICYLLNCKNRIIKQQQDKLWEIRLITESKLIGCDDDE